MNISPKAKFLQSIISIFAITFNIFQPFLFALGVTELTQPQLASANEFTGSSSDNITFDYNRSNNKFKIQFTKDETPSQYQLTYQRTNEEGKEISETIEGTLNMSDESESAEVYLGTCSDDVCTPHQINSGKVILYNDNVFSNFVIDNNQLWRQHNDKYTLSDQAVLSHTYYYPPNHDVQVVFTHFIDEAGHLSIEKIHLTDEEKNILGALDNTAYDITSDMANGSFSYDLVLPVPDNHEDEFKIIYAENDSELSSNPQSVLEEVEITDTKITISDLDHMTIFVVIKIGHIGITLPFDGADDNFGDVWQYRSENGAITNLVPNPTNNLPGYLGTDVAIMNAPGLGRSYLGYTGFTGQTLASTNFSQISWYKYATQNPADHYLNFFIYKGSSYGHVSIVPHTCSSQNTWEVCDSNNSTIRIQYRYWSWSWPWGWRTHTETLSSLSNLLSSYGDWTLFNDLSTRSSLVIVSGSSTTPTNLFNYVDGVRFDYLNGSYDFHNFEQTSDMDSPTVIFSPFSPGLTNNPSEIVYINFNEDVDELNSSELITTNATITNFTNIDNRTYSVELSPIVDGVVTLQVPIDVAFDDAGHGNLASEIYSMTFDITKPTLTIEHPHNDDSFDQSFIVNGTITDNESGVENILVKFRKESDNSLVTSFWATYDQINNTWSLNINDGNNHLDDGYYKIVVRGQDLAGNRSWKHLRHITVDTTPPATPTWGTIYKGHGVDPSNEISCGGYTNNTQVTFEWNENTETDLAGYWFGTQFNPKHQWIPAGSTTKNGNMTPGNNPYFYTIIAVDNIGNESNISQQCSLTLDQDPPEAPENTGFNSYVTNYSQEPTEISCNGSTNLNQISHHWSVINDAVKYQRQWVYPGNDPNDENNWHGTEEWTTNYTNYRTFGGGSGTEGLWHVRVRAQDIAENWSEYSDACAVTYDKTPPAVPTGLRRLAREDHNIVFECNDFSQIRYMHPDWDDNTEPDFDYYEYSSFNAPNGDVGIDEKRFDESIFEYNGSWLPNQGTYGFAVRAVDQTGNKSAWAQSDESLAGSCQINYDDEAPSTPTVLGFINPDLSCGSITNIHNTTVDWTDSTDTGSGFDQYMYFIDYPKPDGTRGEWSTNLSPSQYSGSLNEGIHNIKVKAKDMVGNYSDWSNTCSITTDWTAPDLTIDSIKYADGTIEPNKFVTNLDTPTILGTTSTDATSIILTINGHDYTATLNGVNWDAIITHTLPEGLQTMTVVATDHANNITTETHDIFIDTVAPTVEHVFYKDGNIIGGFHQYYDSGKKFTNPIAYVQNLTQLSFTGTYNDVSPSSNLYWDSYVIFPAQTDGSFAFAQNGTNALCSWRHQPNLVDMSSFNVSYWDLTTPEPLTNCVASADEGEYYLAHHIYDQATRKDIPSINQFRDVLGLHFIVDRTNPTVSASVSPASPNGDNGWYISQPTVTLSASDDQQVDHIEYHWDSDSWSTYSTPLTPSEGVHTIFYRSFDSANNMSSEGNLTIKFDQTIPNPGPENLRVSSLSLPTGTLEWDLASDGISQVNYYDVSWKLKSNTLLSFGNRVDSHEASLDMHSLTDGEWEMRVKAVDHAGNWIETLLLYVIGGGTGTPGTTTTTTSTPPAVLGLTTNIYNPISDVTTQKQVEEKIKNTNDSTGQIKGISTDCTNWSRYLPIILLIIQALIILALSMFTSWTIMIKNMIALGITFTSIFIFWILNKTGSICLTNNNWLDGLNNLYWLWSMLTTLSMRVIGYSIIDQPKEKN